jgi:hypothetical protein
VADDATFKLVMAIGEALVRKGVLDADDLIEAGERSNDDEVDHMLGCIALQAAAPSPKEWQAQQRRKQMRIVPDGGKKD